MYVLTVQSYHLTNMGNFYGNMACLVEDLKSIPDIYLTLILKRGIYISSQIDISIVMIH
ncbi:hypothetical protein SDC9_181399 [bioreactor metagenome]|uniref:Uncharacterized protein n=1 Tax=bioreactor metagenome TaxID=1076179 RepID=A0A645H4I3_9ZZZZ